MSQNEEDVIRNLTFGTDYYLECLKGFFWIGLKWKENRFTWSDQSPFAFVRELELKGSDEKPCFCLRMRYGYKDSYKDMFRWCSRRCSRDFCFICKYTQIAIKSSSQSDDGTKPTTILAISESPTLRTAISESGSITPRPSHSPSEIALLPTSSLICSEHDLNRLVFDSKLMSTPVALALVPSPTSVRKEPNMPIRCNDADGSSDGVSTTVFPSLSPTTKPSVADTLSAVFVGGSVVGVCVVVVAVLVVVYFCYRKRKHSVTPRLSQGCNFMSVLCLLINLYVSELSI